MAGPELRTTTATSNQTPLLFNPTTPRPTIQRRKRKKTPQNNRTLTLCLSVFLCTFIFLYLVGLLLFLPWSSTTTIPNDEKVQRIMKIDKEKVKALLQNTFKHKPNKAERIFDEALEQFQIDRGEKPVAKNNIIVEKNNLRQRDDRKIINVVPPPIGVIVLGMHRSGTSMLSGLLVKGLGYQTGGPLIGQSFDNKKGFFERVDIVLQNDRFLAKQQANWDRNVVAYKGELGYQQKLNGQVKWKEGVKGLKFLNEGESPWLQKDPRMCITLPTWLPMLNKKPAVIFTYRHPLQVALSLRKRNKIEGFPHFPLEKGFRLWIIYNMRAIQNSASLCTVYTSNDAVLANPKEEVQRVADELTNKCKLKPPPISKISQEVVNTFVDPNLQHSKKIGNGKIITTFNEDCHVYDYAREYKDSKSEEYFREYDLYLVAMKLYCDFEKGTAYAPDYGFPDLP